MALAFPRIKICSTVDKEKVIFFILTGQIKNSVLRYSTNEAVG